MMIRNFFFVSVAAISGNGCAAAQTGERNRNQAVDKEEFLNTQNRRFDLADKNNDGFLDQDEYVAFRLASFDRADRDGDGFFERGENRRLQDPERPGLSREKREQLAVDNFQRITGGGAISKDEFLVRSGDGFERADRNNDGKLTRGELRGLAPL